MKPILKSTHHVRMLEKNIKNFTLDSIDHSRYDPACYRNNAESKIPEKASISGRKIAQMDLSALHTPERYTQRFKADKRALVWCHQDAEALPYHLLDISSEGLSFRYRGEKIIPESISKISLYHETLMVVEEIQVQVVSDLLLDDCLVPVRRASILFKDMSAEQRLKLQSFICNHTDQSLAK
jgi:hypothetical protein